MSCLFLISCCVVGRIVAGRFGLGGIGLVIIVVVVGAGFHAVGEGGGHFVVFGFADDGAAEDAACTTDSSGFLGGDLPFDGGIARAPVSFSFSGAQVADIADEGGDGDADCQVFEGRCFCLAGIATKGRGAGA